MNPWKSAFPIFERHPDLIYLDSASTSQRVNRSLQAMDDYHLDFNANVHRGLYPMAETATESYESARATVAKFLGAASPREIVFTRGTTESLNMVAFGWALQHLKPGDEIVLSELEHHANLVPWQQVAERSGAKLVFCPLTDSGEWDLIALESLLNAKTKLITFSPLSNTLGTITDIQSMVDLAKTHGVKVCLDAAQHVAHFPLNVEKMGIDFLAFSGHKIYGPTGVGVLYVKKDVMQEMTPMQFGGQMIREVQTTHSTWNDFPWRLEAGTPPIAEAIGLAAALDWVSEIGWDTILRHDLQLMDHGLLKLKELPFVRILGPANVERQRGVLSLTMDGVHPHDIASILGSQDIAVRAGHHCAMPLMKFLNVSATTRLSFGIYNSPEDIDAACEALKKIHHRFQ